MKVAIVGSGTMGEAFGHSLLRSKLAGKADLTFSDVSQPRLDSLKKKYGATVTNSNLEAIEGVAVIILAVKPQDAHRVMEQIAGKLKSQLIVSIVAGCDLGTICDKLNYRRVVRAMPNAPAQVGKGMTAWTEAKGLTPKDHEIARSFLGSMGAEQYFADEKYIDMATAVSGSGPAYVFLFIESMIDAGVHIGLARNVAERLVLETVTGSVEAMRKTAKHPAELKNMVTSPGGTTAEALLKLESGGLRSLLIGAVVAAYQKARSLGGK
jgi:pyrroline-5-carboxylate reductase